MFKTARNVFGMAIALATFCSFAGIARGEDDVWMTDFAAAKAKAKAEKKLLLVDFTGSDWCGWCIKLHADVFNKETFQAAAPKQFVLVELDFPHTKKLPDELKAQNDKLAKQYKIHGYPSVLLIDAEGEQVAALVGYRAGGPEKYMESLAKLVKLNDRFVEMKGELAQAEGLDRAKLLDRMIGVAAELGKDDDSTQPWIKEIIALDSENKAGLKGKYEFRLAMDEVTRLMRSMKIEEARQEIKKALALPGLSGQQKQDACYMEAQMLQRTQDVPAVIAAMQKALDAAPGGSKAAQIKFTIERLEATVKAEEAALKLKAELDKVEAERLALLDETIQAYTKAGYRIGGKDQMELVQKWMQEAVGLDADNKAGLKAKYEYMSQFLNGQSLFQSGKLKEALAAFDTALAVPDITPDQISRAMLMKCNCLTRQKDYQGAIDCAKKAQEAVQGPMSKIFPLIIQQAERAMRQQKSGKGAEGGAAAIAPIRPALRMNAMPMLRLRPAANEIEKQPAAKKPAAGEKSAASDPDHVPNGSIEELLKYAEGLKKAHSTATDFTAVIQFRRKVAMATVDAADKILAAKPTDEQRATALKLKLEAFSSMPLMLVDDGLVAKQEELIKQCRKAGLAKEARQATRMLLSSRLQRARGPKDQEAVIGMVIDYYRGGPVDKESIGLAVNAGRTAEYGGDGELAAKTYRELAKIFAAQEDKQVVEMAPKLAGAARRLELKETPMLVEGTTLDGKPLDWSKYEGKVVLIDFWATWCGPCRAELPNVRKNYEAYHDRGFEVVGVSLDQKTEDLENFMEKEKLPWTIVRDDSWNKAKPAPGGDKFVPGYLANYYGVFGIPTMILLGKDGKAISINARGDALNKELEKALGPVKDKEAEQDK